MIEDTLGPTLSRPARAAVRPASSAARLSIVHPAHARATIELAGEPCVLGRRAAGPSPGIRDATVSRAHCRVEWDAARSAHTIADLKSRNGTRLDAHPVDAAVQIPDGAVVRIGDVLAVYERWPAELVDAAGVELDVVPGASKGAVRLRAAIERAAADPSPALILGPTGTGKEFVAGELHRLSGRRGPLIPFNCAALSPQLAESQLFGHVRGAFTGADRASKGLFRSAERGAVFLDEIGEMPLGLQPKLLRAIQAREVQPVGQATPIRIDARIIAATHRDLLAQVEAGAFRRDLYGRLALWEIEVPGLAARRRDIVDWFERLFAAWHRARDRAAPTPVLDPDAVEALLLADWPENLRGLDRVVHRVAMRDGVITREHLGLSAPAVVEPIAARPPKPTRAQLMAALTRHDGSVRAVAKAYARDRRQIYRWMEQYGLKGE